MPMYAIVILGFLALSGVGLVFLIFWLLAEAGRSGTLIGSILDLRQKDDTIIDGQKLPPHACLEMLEFAKKHRVR